MSLRGPVPTLTNEAEGRVWWDGWDGLDGPEKCLMGRMGRVGRSSKMSFNFPYMAERGALFLWRGNPWIDEFREFREFCELSWVTSPPRNWWIPWNPWILWIELGYLPTQELINSVNFMNSVTRAGLPPHWWFPWIPWFLWIEQLPPLLLCLIFII